MSYVKVKSEATFSRDLSKEAQEYYDSTVAEFPGANVTKTESENGDIVILVERENVL